MEIDRLAIEHSLRTYVANGVEQRVRSLSSLADAAGPFDLVVANVWRAVLLSLGEPIAKLRAPGASILLSGLVSTDVPEVSVRYARLLGDERPEVYERDEWRALLWRGRDQRPSTMRGPATTSGMPNSSGPSTSSGSKNVPNMRSQMQNRLPKFLPWCLGSTLWWT